MYPANPQLWNNLRDQARAKYPRPNSHGGLTFPQNKWLKEEYAREGGQWVDNPDDVDPRFRDKEDEQKHKDRRKELDKKKRRNRGEIVLGS